MRGTLRGLVGLVAGCALTAGGSPPATAGAQAVIPGFECTTYAQLPFPVALDFDADGNLFAGNEETLQGTTTIKIRRIRPGGAPVDLYGASELPDPDGVLVDDDGSISGTPGAVIVCGGTADSRGQIVAIRPDESMVTLYGPDALMQNPNYMARGRDGLLLSDNVEKTVFEFVPPGPPTPLITNAAVPFHMAVDATSRIFVSFGDGVIRLYDPDGALLDDAYATGLGNGASIALGAGGAFGTDLYAANPDTGQLVRIAPDKTATVIGTGLPTSLGAIAFGRDGALYIASFAAGEVLRVTPAPPPVTSYFLPKKVTAKVNAKDVAKSTLVSGGIFDTGPGTPDFASAATLDVGGLHFDIPGLAPAGKGFAFAGGGVTLSIAPNPYGSSRAKFKLKFTGDLTGKVAPTGPLDLHFKNAVTDGDGIVQLGGGVFGLGKVRGALVQPNLFVVRAHATLKGAGKDAFTVIVGLATSGQTPPVAADLTVGFGDRVFQTIPSGSFARKGSADRFAGNFGGVTKVVVDYAREQISISGKGLDLGPFAQGGNTVLLTAGLGNDVRAVEVRMGRIGATMKY